ncbi:MAG: hypothetical protein NVSMB27_45570 [Ktedonobacteraceae bacterium]
MSDSDEWIDAKTAADILRVTERQVNRRGNDGDLQMKRIGPRRVVYLRADVERLAAALHVSDRPRSQVIPKREMVPMRDVLGTIERAQTELTKAREEVGYLRGQLDAQQKQLADAEATRRQLEIAQARIAELEQQVRQAGPWWWRILRRS